MFELNKKYGWSKFIVVVPSIAIREGVKKSFEVMEDHFFEQCGKKARYFIYNSKNLNQLDNFSSSKDIYVMIINAQAFASSLKEGAKNEAARIIYSKQDSFGSRRPIDVIAANRPIVILNYLNRFSRSTIRQRIAKRTILFTFSTRWTLIRKSWLRKSKSKVLNSTIFAVRADLFIFLKFFLTPNSRQKQD